MELAMQAKLACDVQQSTIQQVGAIREQLPNKSCRKSGNRVPPISKVTLTARSDPVKQERRHTIVIR
jgi:hypothetical protein